MAVEQQDQGHPGLKISRELAARLDRRKPDELMRAVVMLFIGRPATATGRRALRANREKLLDAREDAVRAALDDIEHVLHRHGGHRIPGTEIGALGSIAVETTPAGIRALAECPGVRTVLEDQTVSLIRN